MTLNLRRFSKMATQGFSLTEMLSVVGVIGILSAIAIPNLSRIRESGQESAAKRNAQNLVSICQSAQSAGLRFCGEGTIFNKTVENIVNGGHVQGGTFDGSYFGLPHLSETEQERSLALFDSARSDSIVYLSERSQFAARIQILQPKNPAVAPAGPRHESRQG